jgi:HK97 family phage portal protein
MKIFGLNISREQKQAASDKATINALQKALYQYQLISGMPLWNPANDETAINRGFLYNHIVYAVIQKIIKKASGVPWQVYEVKNTKKAAKYYEQKKLRNYVRAAELKEEAIEPVMVPEIERLMKRPNKDSNWSIFQDTMFGFYLLTGNTYVYILRSTSGEPLELYVCPSQYTEIIGGSVTEPIGGYRINGISGDIIPRENVMHLRTWSPDYSGAGSHLYGISPLKAANRVLQANNDSFTSLVSMFQNQGVRGILSSSGDEAFSFEQGQAIQRRWQELYGKGSENAGKIAVTGAKLNWLQMGLDAIDLSIIDSQKMTLRDICMAFSVPSELFGDKEGATYNNVKEATKEMINNAVLPLFELTKDTFNTQLISWFNQKSGKKYFIDYDVSVFDELTEDISRKIYAIQAANFMTLNEKRKMLFLEPLPNVGMDAIFLPSGYMPIEMVAEPPIIEDLPAGKGLDLYDLKSEY